MKYVFQVLLLKKREMVLGAGKSPEVASLEQNRNSNDIHLYISACVTDAVRAARKAPEYLYFKICPTVVALSIHLEEKRSFVFQNSGPMSE